MAVFVVVHVEDPTSVKTALNKNYRGSYHSLGDRAWLVSARQTARQVATALGFGDAKGTKLSSGLVVSVESYWGRQNKEVWEWLKTNGM